MQFRQIEKEDLPLLRDWRNCEKIRAVTREYRLLNMLNQEKWFEKISLNREDDMFLIIDEKPSRAGGSWGLTHIKVGVCGLTHINWKDRHAEISYYSSLTDPLKNIGLAREVYDFLKKKCFEEYGLNRLWGEVYSFNLVAIKIAQRNGLKIEGILKQTNWHNGRFYDSVITTILAEEYFESIKSKKNKNEKRLN
jgi:RimJ/RimL family protein N-acetyltransferase